jgi:transposase
MLLQEPNLSVWLYAHPVDMRKQFDGLAALAQSKLKRPASSGELFVFINKRRTYIKILYYSRGGYCLWSKRLLKADTNVQRLMVATEPSIYLMMLLIY